MQFAWDNQITLWLNGYSRSSYFADCVLNFFCYADLCKGGVLMLLLWWLWFRRDTSAEQRARILVSFPAAIAAVTLARALAFALPYRERPLHTAALNLTLPYTVETDTLMHWSSFPSDHAALFMAFAAGLVFVSRRLGWMTIAFSVLIILFPRVYAGIHFTSDVLVGAMIGMVMAWAFNRPRSIRLARQVLPWAERRPEYFYPAFFLLSYQTADLFEGFRQVASLGLKLVHPLAGSV